MLYLTIRAASKTNIPKMPYKSMYISIYHIYLYDSLLFAFQKFRFVTTFIRQPIVYGNWLIVCLRKKKISVKNFNPDFVMKTL